MGNGFKKGLKRMITFTVAGAVIIQSSFAGFAPYERTYANDVNELEEKSQVIQVDDTVSVTVSSEEPYAYFSFTPEETNEYFFYSTGDCDTYCDLYDSDGETISYNDDGGEGNNFRLNVVLSEGTTYYFGARQYYSGAEADFSVTLEKSDEFNVYAVGYESSGSYVNMTVDPLADLNLEVGVCNPSSAENIQYSWSVDGEVVSTTNTFNIEDIDSDKYVACSVTDSGTDTTREIDYNIDVYNEFSAWAINPDDETDTEKDNLNVNVPLGNTATLSVGVSAKVTSRISYKWMDSNSWTELGDTDDTYVIDNVSASKTYVCEVNDGFGSSHDIYFNVIANSFKAYATDSEEKETSLTITVNPGEEDIELAVTVEADDTSLLTSKWYKDGSEITAEENKLKINVDFNEESDCNYWCTVNDGYGNSEEVYFTLNLDNEFNANLKGYEATEGAYDNKSIYVGPGEDLTLEIETTGCDVSKVSYKWYTDYSEIEDATSSSYTVNSVVEATTYLCEVNDGYGNTKYIYIYVGIDNEFEVYAVGTDNEQSNEIYIAPGESTTLQVGVNALKKDKIEYKWYDSNYNKIDGEETDSLALSNIGESTTYSCEVYDGYSENSATVYFYVTVENHFSAYIDGQDEGEDYVYLDAAPNEEKTIKIIATADDTSKMTYEWYKDGELISEETSNEITTDPITTAIQYSCIVSDGYSNSAEFYLNFSVENDFEIDVVGYDSSWVRTEAEINSTPTFEISPSGLDVSKVTYKWYKNDEIIDGATTNSYTCDPITEYNEYKVIASDGYGNTAIAIIDVYVLNNLEVYATGYPYLVNNVDIGVPKNENINLSVTATAINLDGITYKWTCEGSTIEDATSSSYLVENVTGPKSYECEVTDKYNTKKYVNFYVYVENHFTATIDGKSGYKRIGVTPNETIELTNVVTADDMDGITYRWYKNDNKIPNRTASITTEAITEPVNYTCYVTDAYGSEEYLYYELYAENNLDAYLDGYSQGLSTLTVEADEHESVTLNVIGTADDTEGITYQWRDTKKDEDTGVTTSSYTIDDLTTCQSFECIVTDKYKNTDYVYVTVEVSNSLKVVPTVAGEEHDKYSNIYVPYGSGEDLGVTVTARDMEGISYKWYEDGKVISGEESNSFRVDSVTKATTYTCEVTDKYNNTRVVDFSLNVDNRLKVYAKGYEDSGKSVDVVVPYGETATLEVVAEADDTSNMSTYWEVNGNSSYESSFTVTTKPITASTVYQCYVYDRYGNYDWVTYNVNVDNEFTVSAVGYEDQGSFVEIPMQEGETTTLKVNVNARDMDGVTYTWSNNYEIIEGAVTDSITTDPFSANTVYLCEVEDKYGNTKTIEFDLVADTDFDAWFVGYEEEDNVSFTLALGDSKTLEVGSSGEDVTFEWYDENFEAIPDATTSSFTISNIQQATEIYCIASDKYENSKTLKATIAIDNKFDAYDALSQKNEVSLGVEYGLTANLEVTATATDTSKMKYQWYENNKVISGATTNSYSTSEITKNTTFKCNINDGYGNSKDVIYTVYVNAEFDAWPEGHEGESDITGVSVTAAYNDPLVLKVVAQGDGLSYVWKKNNVRIQGANEDRYEVPNVTYSATFTCTVSDVYGNTKDIEFFVAVDNELKAYVKGTTDNATTLDLKKGEEATLAVDVSALDTEGITYEWRGIYKNSSGENYTKRVGTGDEYTFVFGEEDHDYYSYTCGVSDRFGNTCYVEFDVNDATIATVPAIAYKVQIQKTGWEKKYVTNGTTSGTVGKALRLEAIRIKLINKDGTAFDLKQGGVEYKTHIQKQGWEKSYASNDALSGTVGKALRLEAIKIRLTGDISNYYDIYYRVQAEKFGWLGWAVNDEEAGTAGYGFRLEGIQIMLVKKGEDAPTSAGGVDATTKAPYYSKTDVPTIQYRVQVQTFGWQKYVKNGSTSGTVGKAKRLEAIRIKIADNKGYSGSITYRTHVQRQGWQSFVSNDELSGTVGKALRLEAIQIKLTGNLAKEFDVYYRVQAQKFGWMGWAKNGEQSGTAGYGYRLEAIQIQIVRKGTPSSVVGSTSNAFRKK